MNIKTALTKTAVLVVGLCLANQLAAQLPKQLEVKELQLSNGMKVWLNEDHSQPKVFGAVVVNAGAKDCPNTGIAHYFEHIMFKGTDQIGTIDYGREKPWLDSIAAAYDRLAATTDATQREAIQKDINRLSHKAGEYAIPNEFNNLTSFYGGSRLNAGTSYDFTFYHNLFTPQFMEQWCQLNSDRLINPVFRMFQGELETVYEEKNRSSDNMINGLREALMSELFGTQPYAYPIIGSTENLKNPKLSDMKKFYEKYYVGSNMGLLLCGDFQADNIMPLLERTFGRIPKGVAPKRNSSTMPDITAERTVEVKMPIPLISMEMLAYKAPTEFEKDANALDVACNILYDGNAGMLDSLANERVLMVAALSASSLNDAGIGMLILVPRPLAKTEKAEAACREQMKRLWEGNFSQQVFEVQKQLTYREAMKELETIEARAEKMVTVMASGHSWQDYINKVNAINKITKADVMAAAKRYLDAPFIRLKKKFGHQEKDKMSQPGYTPVKPKNVDAESDYARKLAAIPVQDIEPRLIDFERDATTTKLSPHATLYTVENPMNDLFQLTVEYNYGAMADTKMPATVAMLNSAGTDSLTRQQFGAALQALGADITFESDEKTLTMTISGVDKNFMPTMELAGHIVKRLLPDDKAMDNVRDEIKTEEKSLASENSDVMTALMRKVMYGNKSPYLQRITSKEAKKMTGEELAEVFKKALTSTSTYVYSGTLKAKEVEEAIRKTLPVELSKQPFVSYGNDFEGYDRPLVYVFDMPKSRQTLFFTYDQMKAEPSAEERIPAELLRQYFGGGMSSVLFQEVREFRSMAYTTSCMMGSRSFKLHPTSPMALLTVTGTQADKTMSAVALVDSLLQDMPRHDKNFRSARQDLINKLSSDFPSFREMGSTIASQKQNGFTQDINTGKADLLKKATFADMEKFYKENIKNNRQHRVFGIVGNKKKLNLKELEKYGTVVFVKEKDLFRK